MTELRKALVNTAMDTVMRSLRNQYFDMYLLPEDWDEIMDSDEPTDEIDRRLFAENGTDEELIQFISWARAWQARR